jgi:hypothetical protein
MKSPSSSCHVARAASWAGLLLAAGLCIVPPSAATPATQSPPLGWNSFDAYGGAGAAINLMKMADFLADPAHRLTHFKYVVVDDGWMHARVSRTRTIRGQSKTVEDLDPHVDWIRADASTGMDDDAAIHKLQAAGLLSQTFDVNKPEDRSSFMKALGDYVHGKGMKFGLYTSQTPKTCFGYPGSLGHELEDASLLASWGVDFVKLDDCAYDNYDIANWKKIIDLLREFNPAIVVSLSNQGLDKVPLKSPVITECVTGAPVRDDSPALPKEWSRQVGADMWRAGGDVLPNWGDVVRGISAQARFLVRCSNLVDGWTDGDFLGAAGFAFWGPPGPQRYLTLAENRTQLSVWAMFNSPLIAGFKVEDGQSGDPHRRRVFFDGLSLLANPTLSYIDQTSIAGTGAIDVAVPGHERLCEIAGDQGNVRLPCVMALARWLVKPDCKAGKAGEYAFSISNLTDAPLSFRLPLRDIEAALGGAAGACGDSRSMTQAWGNLGSLPPPSEAYQAGTAFLHDVLPPRDSVLARISMKAGRAMMQLSPTTLQNRATGLCMQAQPDGALVQAGCTGGPTQQFQHDYDANHIYAVDWSVRDAGNRPSLLPIEPADESGATGTRMVRRAAGASGREWWNYGHPEDSIRAYFANKCIGPQPNADGSVNGTAGAPLVLLPCNNPAVRWAR